MPDTAMKVEGISPETAEIPIPVRAYLGPIILEIPAKPAQVAVVVRMATQELLAAGIISPRVAGTAEEAIQSALAAQMPEHREQIAAKRQSELGSSAEQ